LLDQPGGHSRKGNEDNKADAEQQPLSCARKEIK
jgi:hypothetical protein